MAEVQTVHTSALGPGSLSVVQALLTEVFGEAFTDDDWEHTLGGMHALIWEGDELIGHAAVVQRRLLHRGRALRVGYVESVGVRSDRRGCGHGASLMDAMELVLRSSYELGALSASDAARRFYRARHWKAWRGPLSALTPDGVQVAMPERDIYVLEYATPVDVADRLTCDWRDGDLW
jgi:aminoglycoside 2'-N-acetyltransferase I